MPDWVVPVLIIALVVAIAVAVWLYLQNRRSHEIRERFGPEYDRTVNELHDPRRAESVLAARERRVERLDIRELSPDERRHFGEAWRSVQARFVDDPTGAVRDADELIGQVMQARGYPVGDFEQRAADVSVDHPDVVQNYRAAHRIAGEAAVGRASTEDLRQAMVHYRSLFDELLGTAAAPNTMPESASHPPLHTREPDHHTEVM